jgi:hypothetical protein
MREMRTPQTELLQESVLLRGKQWKTQYLCCQLRLNRHRSLLEKTFGFLEFRDHKIFVVITHAFDFA